MQLGIKLLELYGYWGLGRGLTVGIDAVVVKLIDIAVWELGEQELIYKLV